MQAQQAVRKYFVSNAAYAAPIHSRDVRHIMLYKHAQAKQLVWVVVREIASATVYLYNARPHHPSRLMLYTYTKSHSRSLYHLPPPYAYSQYELKIATVQEKQHEKKNEQLWPNVQLIRTQYTCLLISNTNKSCMPSMDLSTREPNSLGPIILTLARDRNAWKAFRSVPFPSVKTLGPSELGG